MLFLGADLSLTGSGLVVVDEDGSVVAMEKFTTGAVGVERLYLLEELLQEFLKKHKGISYCCIEGAAMRETGRLFDIGEWAGIFKLVLFKAGIHYIIAAPLQLKKFISGTGENKGKAVVMLDVYKNYGVEMRDDNLADGFVLSQIARSFYFTYVDKQGVTLKKHQEEVLKKIMDAEKVREKERSVL